MEQLDSMLKVSQKTAQEAKEETETIRRGAAAQKESMNAALANQLQEVTATVALPEPVLLH